MINDKWEPNCCAKWTEKLNRQISWKKCLKKIHQIKDIKLKWMQMRIVHRIIATNVVLKEMGIVESYNCGFCNEEKDSIEHMFWRCAQINEFWKSLEELIKRKCVIANNLSLNENVVLFGIDENFITDSTFDLIILIAKHYIFNSKINKCKPTVTVFIKILKTRYNLEKYIAATQLTLPKFNDSWINYELLLEN